MKNGSHGKVPDEADMKRVSDARRRPYGHRLLEQNLSEEKQMEANPNDLAEAIYLEAIELEDLSVQEQGFREYLAKSGRTKQRRR